MGVRFGKTAGIAAHALGLALLLSACGSEEQAPLPDEQIANAGPLQVYAVNNPLAWMAATIGGDAVEVHLPLPAAVDPAFWQPTAEDILPWQQADLILRNGAGYAAWMDYASLPRARLVDTSAGFLDRLLPLHASTPHSHGPEGEHSHGPLAFTLWLDLDLAARQADVIYQQLLALRPEAANVLQKQHGHVRQQLGHWDSRLAELAEALQGRSLFYSHPVYQYFSERYGLPGVSLHWEPDADPGEAGWRQLEGLLDTARAPLMIWEDEPLDSVRERLQALGVEVLVFEPAGGVSAEGFDQRMEANLTRLSELVP